MTSTTAGGTQVSAQGETRQFIDTNVLVYAYDRQASTKHDVAKRLLRELWESRKGVLSPQVLQEFYVTVTRKIPRPLSKPEGSQLVSMYGTWHVQPVGVAEIQEAINLETREPLSFWDALIVVAASRSGATVLVSEDLQAGRSYLGVTVENPFVSVA